MTKSEEPADDAVAARASRYLTEQQVEFFEEHGYLHIAAVFAETELTAMDSELNEVLARWGLDTVGWTGEWREVYMDADVAKLGKLVGVEGVDLYSPAWFRAVTNENLCDAMVDLLGSAVEYHHSTTHVKPPGTGDPVPLHQDLFFYRHTSDRFVANLVHLDDTNEENGCICFLPGSHKAGPLVHVTEDANGAVVPYLSPERYQLAHAVRVPARRGDVVAFNYNTIHGSGLNRTSKLRRLVRVGYRDPENHQVSGEWCSRPGPMVRGIRPRGEKQAPLPVPDRLY